METGKVLVLRCVREDMSSSLMFYWPVIGSVECEDWDSKPVCGNGLHGWLWGEGDIYMCPYWKIQTNKWLVVEVDSTSIVQLDGKVKFPKGKVVLCGTQDEASMYVYNRAPSESAVMLAKVSVGDHKSVRVGMHGTATSGHYGTSIAGNGGIAVSGDHGTSRAGHYSYVITGHNGRATARNDSTAMAGDNGTATAGDYGTAMAGINGTAMAGYKGTIMIKWLDYLRCTVKWKTGEIGGPEGLMANVQYRLNPEGEFVRVFPF